MENILKCAHMLLRICERMHNFCARGSDISFITFSQASQTIAQGAPAEWAIDSMSSCRELKLSTEDS